jgi:signal transduction histidine kinase
LIAAMRAAGCQGPTILLTGMGGVPEIDRAAAEVGAADFIEKSRLDPVLLERSIRYALLQRGQELELERKVQERTAELAAANAALRDADRRKDEFLATLAHELRNPLAPIRNALEIMRMAADNPPAVEKSRAMVERQVKQLVRLIDDLLDASRMTRDKLRVDLDPLDLADPIGVAVESGQPLLDRAGVRFELHLPPGPVTVRGDRVRLTQLLTNLLTNAAKYTESGGTVTLTVEKADAHVRVRVRDTGVGIPPELLPRVFDLFTQVDRTLNRSQGGLGIGLALARRLARMHGGELTAASDGPGKGSEFVVTLPRPTSATNPG